MSDQSYADRVVELYRSIYARHMEMSEASKEIRSPGLSYAYGGRRAQCEEIRYELAALFPELAGRFAEVRAVLDE